ncbi:hypothetical protein JRO89_XS09G0199200 [Xanthoceras sorbifolium]|uniref:Malectin-like domain-containing protein n=1 Tax=Xanthoceras sorbifolium TaxID=99658 RepID=A0ABQ8HM35_9ROSI|nr:hypothetical protein JRO89_XS09G0199200 [Xanthoceras sorbifolium]
MAGYEIFKHVMFAFLGVVIALTVLVHAQSQSGFISINCGLPKNSGYTDEKTGIDYAPDVNFIENGASYNISSDYSTHHHTLEKPFLTVRSFPKGIRNCYTLKPICGDLKFLI